MPKQLYNWKRFWCPPTSSFSLADGGYLSDPDSNYGRYFNPDVVSFEAIAETPCLVLLGEPGMGKTHAMRAEANAIRAQVQAQGAQTLLLDLRSYGSEDRLVAALFENDAFRACANGECDLHLFLDSLDECLLRIDTVAALLVDELRKYPTGRLRLRIACRTADWPNGLEEGLRALWGEAAVGVYELVPLRKADVAEAARAVGLPSDAFMDEIDRISVVPLAIKPITLDFLLRTYGKSGGLPSTQADLYHEGCRLLCEETSQSRRDAQRTGDYTAQQRMAIAARIAAVTIFANRYAIWTSIDRGDVPDENITITELCGRGEPLDGEQVAVTDAAIRETLSTGLFSSRGPHRMGWAHQTYAEFLAAWYLVRHDVALGQAMSLIVHPGDPDGKLVPQLHETAAWLASLQPDVFRKITKTDPEVPLQSDVAAACEEDRAELVDTLLRSCRDGPPEFASRTHFRKLAHPGLPEQLRAYIADQQQNLWVRYVAMDVAKACELRELQSLLAQIALDPSEALDVRVNAARAVGRVGDAETKATLKPLAVNEIVEDNEDQLKGASLRATWPDHVNAAELFAALTPPKRPSLYGTYHGFMTT